MVKVYIAFVLRLYSDNSTGLTIATRIAVHCQFKASNMTKDVSQVFNDQ
jgi:hypothetical protein